MTPLQTQALSLLKLIHQKKYEAEELNTQIAEYEQSDFYANQINPIHSAIEEELIKFIDAVVGDTVGSYFLYETTNMKNGGTITTADGKVWIIKTIEDVIAYVEANCP